MQEEVSQLHAPVDEMLSAEDQLAAGAGEEGVEKVLFHLEVQLLPTATASRSDLEPALRHMLRHSAILYRDGPLLLPLATVPVLAANVASVTVADTGCLNAAPAGQAVMPWHSDAQLYIYQLNEESVSEEVDEGEDGGSGGVSYREWLLPAAEFSGLWESLVYESDLKQRLLRYSAAALRFSDAKVDPQLISWNRVVLLHGPPGTGKTSLCCALAQKLAIRWGSRFSSGVTLIELNSHSLFSKWFSESGKLVGRLFAKVGELLEDPDALVLLLIDEVESLSAARTAGGSEPGDAVRVVNALLTQLDALRAKPNVMVLTTTNLTGALDLAFVDRADIKAHVPLPSLRARYVILRSALRELVLKGLVGCGEDAMPTDWVELPPEAVAGAQGDMLPAGAHPTQLLLSLAAAAEGLSGRALRKLPFLAGAAVCGGPRAPGAAAFLRACHEAALAEREERAAL